MLVVFGVISDRVRVRKPFMLVGAVGTIVMTIVLLRQIDHPTTGYYSNVFVVVLLGLFIGVAYTPWMAGYTEAVEAHNPALSATGLAVWGWVLRIVVALSFIVLPRVITTSTTLVDNQGRRHEPADVPSSPSPMSPRPGTSTLGPRRQASSRRSTRCSPTGPARPWRRCSRPTGRPTTSWRPWRRCRRRSSSRFRACWRSRPWRPTSRPGAPCRTAQIAAVQASSPQLATLLRVEQKVIPAQKASGNEWKRWWWVCVSGQLVFLVLVFFMRGRWSPRAAKADFDQHERLVTAELDKLRGREPRVGGTRRWRPPAPRTARCGVR